jgi:hypothetical protein
MSAALATDNPPPLAVVTGHTGGKGGRPTKLTPELRKKLVDCISRGVPASHACKGVGISFATYQNWRRDHEDFDLEIDQAIAASMERLLEIVEKAAVIDASKATWLLEHRWPEHFARNRIELTGAGGQPLASQIIFLPPKNKVEDSPPLAIPATVTDIETSAVALSSGEAAKATNTEEQST